jgi:hypothetical protein
MAPLVGLGVEPGTWRPDLRSRANSFVLFQGFAASRRRSTRRDTSCIRRRFSPSAATLSESLLHVGCTAVVLRLSPVRLPGDTSPAQLTCRRTDWHPKSTPRHCGKPLDRVTALSSVVDVSSMSQRHHDNQQDAIDNRVNDPVVPHAQSITGSAA